MTQFALCVTNHWGMEPGLGFWRLQACLDPVLEHASKALSGTR